MSAVQGDARPTVSNSKYVGFTQIEVKAVNPTREELNTLLEREGQPEDKEIEYLSKDQEGNDRVRLSFWLEDKATGKYFVHSFNMINKVRRNKDNNKVQVINSTLNTTWVPLIIDSNGEVTDEPDLSLLPQWFTSFVEKKSNDILGDKTVRPALVGEEELATFVRAWLGGLNFSLPNAKVVFDNSKFFNEDFSELQELVDGDFSKPFVILVGVRTDENDSTKQYQQVWGKGFLPTGSVEHIKKNFKGSSDFIKKAYGKFEEEVSGVYGFSSFFKLEPLSEYNASEDPAQSEGGVGTSKAVEVTPINSKF